MGRGADPDPGGPDDGAGPRRRLVGEGHHRPRDLERALVGSPYWRLGQDERNAAVYEENLDRPLADVLAEARSVWAELLPGLESLTDDDLNDPSHFQGLSEAAPGVPPWQIFAGSTFKHYEEHAADLRAWLDRSEGERV